MPRRTHRLRQHDGASATIGLVALAVGLLILAGLVVLGTPGFGAGDDASVSGGGGPAAVSPILSRSKAETEIRRCAEGRASTYGDPPTPAQQAHCVRDLLAGISGSAAASG
ncbi:MAG: hypothetical protein ACRDY1_09925 [Acidimicrobiales bacterium]